MRFYEFKSTILESAGFAPKIPASFKAEFTSNDGKTYKWVENNLGTNGFPQDTRIAYETVEEMAEAIAEVEQQLGQQIQFIKNAGTNRSFGFMGFENTQDPNDKIYIGTYAKGKVQEKQPNLRQNEIIQAGLQIGTKAQVNAKAKLGPKDVGVADGGLHDISSVSTIIDTYDGKSGMNGMLSRAKNDLINGNPVAFVDGKDIRNGIQNDFCEILSPIVLYQHLTNKGNQNINISGNPGNAIENSLSNILGPTGAQLNGKMIFPPSATNPLVDSFLETNQQGQRYGISHKGKKGAKATITNIYSAMKKSPDAVLEKFAKAKEILELIIGARPAYLEQPIQIARHFDIITDIQEQLVREIYSKRGSYKFDSGPTPEHEKMVPEELLEIYKWGTYRAGGNLGNLLLANIAKRVADIINSDKDINFSAATKAFLDSADFVQINSFVSIKGNDAVYDKIIVTYPPIFEGNIAIWGGAYDSTRAEAFKFSIPYK